MLVEDRHIVKIANGDIKMFQEFFETFYPSLCRFCFSFVKSTDSAADIAQEAMIKFWKSRESHISIKQAKVYLFTIARNDSINFMLRNQMVEDHSFKYAENKEFISNAYIEDEVFDILHTAVDTLPPQSKNIILLALKDYQNKQIAEELNISVNTVKSLKKTAYATLRVLLKDRVFELLLVNMYLFG